MLSRARSSAWEGPSGAKPITFAGAAVGYAALTHPATLSAVRSITPQLAALAVAIDEKMPALGIPKEDRAFSPHLTLARGAGGSGSPRRNKKDAPNRVFQRLQEKLAVLPTPEFGTMTPRSFFLYQSKLSPKGSKYTKLLAFDLK